MTGLQSSAIVTAALVIITILIWGSCAAIDTEGPAGEPAAPPEWDRTALYPGQVHRYSIQLTEGEVSFSGWMEIEFGTESGRSTLAWDLGGDQGSDTGPAGDSPRHLLAMGDTFTRSLLLSTLQSPLLEEQITFVEGWKWTFEDDGHSVTVTVEKKTKIGSHEGYLTLWQVEGPVLALEMEAVIDPARALPLRVMVTENRPGDFTLEVWLERVE